MVEWIDDIVKAAGECTVGSKTLQVFCTFAKMCLLQLQKNLNNSENIMQAALVYHLKGRIATRPYVHLW